MGETGFWSPLKEWRSKDSGHLRISISWKKVVNVGQNHWDTERRENTSRLAQTRAGPRCVCVFCPGVLHRSWLIIPGFLHKRSCLLHCSQPGNQAGNTWRLVSWRAERDWTETICGYIQSNSAPSHEWIWRHFQTRSSLQPISTWTFHLLPSP